MRIISGAYKGRSLKTTTGPGFRPAMGKVREALFSMLEARGVDWPTARVLDLFAGSGSLGFEALSRGAAYAAFVESAPYAVKVIQSNAALLGVEGPRFAIWREEVRAVLTKRPERPFSVVFIDPPYALDALGQTLAALLRGGWAAPGGIINAEVEARGAFSPDSVDARLETLADRSYGQTRVILWGVAPEEADNGA
jgi:16S rRNA (guanine966-N2)-methyltransferase